MYLALRIVAQNVFLVHKQSTGILEVLYFYILFIFLL